MFKAADCGGASVARAAAAFECVIVKRRTRRPQEPKTEIVPSYFHVERVSFSCVRLFLLSCIFHISFIRKPPPGMNRAATSLS